jgi:hypothetical protein
MVFMKRSVVRLLALLTMTSIIYFLMKATQERQSSLATIKSNLLMLAILIVEFISDKDTTKKVDALRLPRDG